MQELNLENIAVELLGMIGVGGFVLLMVMELIKTSLVKPLKDKYPKIDDTVYFCLVRTIIVILALVVAFVNKVDALVMLGYPGFSPEVGYVAYALLLTAMETSSDAVADKIRVALGLKKAKAPDNA